MKYSLLLSALITLTACSSNQVSGGAKGATTGAVSAGLLGAMTDLIVDGKVDTYRLERNLTAGAIAGGAAGAAHGTQKDKQQPTQPAKGAGQTANTEALKQKIGPDNYSGLQQLIHCNHADAFRSSMRARASGSRDIMEAGIALQGLIDLDRGNSAGVDSAISEYIAANKPMAEERARSSLNGVHNKLIEERRVLGLAPKCQ